MYKLYGRDYSQLPAYKNKAAQEKNKEKSEITLKYLYLQ